MPHSPRRGLYLGLVTAIGSTIGLAVLGGCMYMLFYGSEGACEETKAGERMTQISTAAPAAPAGTTPVVETTGVECMDDSGEPYVAAYNDYTHDVGAQSLAIHYWDIATKEGWKAVGTRKQAPDKFQTGLGMCFYKDIAGEPALLRVGSTGPTVFTVSVESTLDGSKFSC